ncbi:MAG TPA: response regulator, partial [Elusimicrobiota bacterium]|nr:response regulator [Elusimicrobiota bacterium]
MAQAKTRLVVADDQTELLSLMKMALEMDGYDVTTASDGEEALQVIRDNPPDIAVIDLWMPKKDGFEVCAELKSDPALSHMPIIILSGAGSKDDKIQGMELGIDDFVTKPVELAELLARIRMILRRSQQDLDANPLTRLPGNVSIQRRITDGIAAQKPLAVLYLDLNGFKAYNDAYGFEAGDQVIKATAQLLIRAVRASGPGKDFVGHIGGDDFIIVSDPDRMEPLSAAIIQEFDALAPTFYKEEDRKRGKILAQDRQGKLVEFPLLSIAIGV